MDNQVNEAARQAWAIFTSEHILLPQVRPVIAESWERCWARIDPYAYAQPHHLSDRHLLSMQVNRFDLMAIARPLMEDVYQYIEESNPAILFTNNVGYLLDIVGDASIISRLEEMKISPGTLLGEGVIGTNAIGLALLERTPQFVFGFEHFLQAFQQHDCAAAPVFDTSGKLIGVLGVIALRGYLCSYSVGMITAAARSIESQIQADQLLEEQNNQLTRLNAILSSIQEGIIVWNSDGVILHTNPAIANILRVKPGSLPGSKLDAYIRFPSLIQDALQAQRPLTDIEAQLTAAGEPINCLISLQYIHGRHGSRTTIAILRPLRTLREYVQKQVGALTFNLHNLVGKSEAIQRVRRMARNASGARGSVLIRGEPGTGKNLLARAIHHHSPRSQMPFVIFACTAVPSELALTELIGSEKGGRGNMPAASKFELADGGTLFFQDIDQLPLDAQSVLLNFLELGILQKIDSRKAIEADARVIASSSAPLEHLVKEGNFRADLLYRLSSFEIALPPLRERKPDLDLLIEQILQRLSKQIGHRLALSQETASLLKAYPWPGNARELESVLTRASVQASPSEIITPRHLPQLQPISETELNLPYKDGKILPLEEMEKRAVLQAAQYCQGNVTRMSQVLGVSRTTLWRYFNQMGLSPEEFRLSNTKS